MTLLEHAKTFMAAKAAKIALAVVPITVLSLAPQAAEASAMDTAIFTSSSCMATAMITGICLAQQVSSANANSKWVSVFSETIGSANGDVEVDLMGDPNGAFGGTQSIPLSWDFLVNYDGSGGSLHWDLQFNVASSMSGPYGVNPVGSLSAPGEVTGGIDIMVPAGVAITGLEVRLIAHPSDATSISYSDPAGGTFGVSTASTPEPSTLLLTGSAVAGLMLRRRKKPAQA